MSGRIPPPGDGSSRDIDSSTAMEMEMITRDAWIGVNAISAIGSLAVIITGIVFYKQLVRKKVYMKMIMILSFCDILSDIAGMTGFPTSQSMCQTQAVVMMYCFRTSWLWCVFITLTLYWQIKYNKVLLTVKQMSLFIFPFDILLLCLPFAGGVMYGGCENGTNFGGLALSGGGHYSSLAEEISKVTRVTIWFFCMFFVPLIIYIIIMMTLSWRLYFLDLPKLQASSTSDGDVYGGLTAVQAKKAQKCIKNVLIYPVLMIIAWLPAFFIFCILFVFIMTEAYWDPSYSTYLRTSLLPSQMFLMYFGNLYGFLMASSFFWKSNEARRLWTQLLLRVYTKFKGWISKTPVQRQSDMTNLELTGRSALEPGVHRGRESPSSNTSNTSNSDNKNNKNNKNGCSHNTNNDSMSNIMLSVMTSDFDDEDDEGMDGLEDECDSDESEDEDIDSKL